MNNYYCKYVYKKGPLKGVVCCKNCIPEYSVDRCLEHGAQYSARYVIGEDNEKKIYKCLDINSGKIVVCDFQKMLFLRRRNWIVVDESIDS